MVSYLCCYDNSYCTWTPLVSPTYPNYPRSLEYKFWAYLPRSVRSFLTVHSFGSGRWYLVLGINSYNLLVGRPKSRHEFRILIRHYFHNSFFWLDITFSPPIKVSSSKPKKHKHQNKLTKFPMFLQFTLGIILTIFKLNFLI